VRHWTACGRPLPFPLPLPAQVVVVQDVDAAVAFYLKAFAAQEIVKIPGPGGKTAHGQVRVGDTILFIALEPENRCTYSSPETLGGTTTAVYSYWDDCDVAGGSR
jgi:PhnB protein